MKSIKTILPFVLFLLVIPNANAGEKWTQYESSNEINDSATQGNHTWCATARGVVRWNSADLTYTLPLPRMTAWGVIPSPQ